MVEGRPEPKRHNSLREIKGSQDGYHISEEDYNLIETTQEPIHARLHDLDSPDDHAGTLSESKVSFDTDFGHDHDGTNSKKVAYSDLSSIPSDFPPSNHHLSHGVGGTDEISVTGLSGVLSEDQPPQAHDLDGVKHIGQLNEDRVTFDIGSGHDHDGVNSKKVQTPHNDLPDIDGETYHISELIYNALLNSPNSLSGSNPVVDMETFGNANLGLTPRTAVIDFYDPSGGLPATPSNGDGYISTATANGWTENNVYYWNGSSWDEEVSSEGDMRALTALSSVYMMASGNGWTFLLTTVSDHGSLTGLSDDDHPQYHDDTRGDVRYYPRSDAEVMVDSKISTHSTITDAHHSRYTDSEAITAMGVKDDTNPLNHDRVTDAEITAIADTEIATHSSDENAHHPKLHHPNHELGGIDELNVSGLSGVLAEPQTPSVHDLSGVEHNTSTLSAFINMITDVTKFFTNKPKEISTITRKDVLTDNDLFLLEDSSSGLVKKSTYLSSIKNYVLGGLIYGVSSVFSRSGNVVAQYGDYTHDLIAGIGRDDHHNEDHKERHQSGGADEISVTGLHGLLADQQTPLPHSSTHSVGGTDEVSVEGLSGLLADDQNPLEHSWDKHTTKVRQVAINTFTETGIDNNLWPNLVKENITGIPGWFFGPLQSEYNEAIAWFVVPADINISSGTQKVKILYSADGNVIDELAVDFGTTDGARGTSVSEFLSTSSLGNLEYVEKTINDTLLLQPNDLCLIRIRVSIDPPSTFSNNIFIFAVIFEYEALNG